MQASIAYTDHITLNHRQSSFSLDYAGIDFLSPGKLNYACKLEGFDREWNRVGKFRRAGYSNLPPGKYTFLVKAINSEGMESPTPSGLRITVLPAPWFSWMAWTSYILIFLFITFLLFRQSFKIKVNRRLLEMEHREREREKEITEMKMHFFTNISHELRTPLTLISAPLEQLWALNMPDKPKQLLEQELSNPQLNVDAVGKELGFSRTAFYRKMKGLTDMSPIDFMRSYRLRRAAEMIRENADTLSDIAEKTGFGSYSYFSKSFRNHFGINPKDYKSRI